MKRVPFVNKIQRVYGLLRLPSALHSSRGVADGDRKIWTTEI